MTDGGQVSVCSELQQWIVLTADERKNLKRLKEQNRETNRQHTRKGRHHKGDYMRPLEMIGTSSLSRVLDTPIRDITPSTWWCLATSLLQNSYATLLLHSNSPPSRVRNSLTVEWALPSVNPQPLHFINNSLGLPHAPSLSVCLFL